MREKMLAALGKLESNGDINLTELSEEVFDRYTRKLVEYNVSPTERVQSWLLIPNGVRGKLPAVLAIHRHAAEWSVGKSEVVGLTDNGMYSYGLDLVMRGYIVLAPDIICFESRQGQGSFRESVEGQKTYERFKFCEYLLRGSTLQAKTLHDLSVALDVLCSLDCVDTDRIGALGHSLGGQEAIWLQWFDRRVSVGAASCGVSMLEDILDNGIIHNFYLYIPGMLTVCDMDEIIKDIVSDRKLIITAGLRDTEQFPLKGIAKINETNAANGNFTCVSFDDGHSFNDSEKKIVYKFLDDNLRK